MAAARLRRLPAWLLPALALLALAAGLLWLPPAEHAQAQDGSPAAITSGPVITSSPASGDAYAKGETIAVALTFSEAVTVAGDPRIRLTIGERKRWARHSGADGATLTFTYTVKGNDQDGDGVSIGKNALKLNKGSIADGDGNAASLSHPALADQAGHKVNISPETPAEPEPTPTPTPEPEPPQITAGPTIVSSPESGDAYGKDEAIVVAVTFSKAVTVTGEPRVRISIGERKRWARYSGANGATLTFAYKVKGNDRDEDGISIGANQLRLNGGSIADGDGNAASLSHPALTDQAGHQVDGSQEPPADGQQQRQAEPEPANSPPQFAAGAATTRTVNEDAAVGANVGDAVAATDADGDALTYAVTGSDAFAIGESTGQIGVNGALDYETQSGYALTVTVSDGKNAAGEADAGVDATIAVTVSVVNVDEAGVVSLELEKDPPEVGGALRAVLLDPDGVVGDIAWTWQRSSDATTWKTIAGAAGATYTAATDDAGSYLRATSGYADGHGAGKTAQGELSEPVAAIITLEEQRTERQTPPTVPTITGIKYTADSNIQFVMPGYGGYGFTTFVANVFIFSENIVVTGTPELTIIIKTDDTPDTDNGKRISTCKLLSEVEPRRESDKNKLYCIYRLKNGDNDIDGYSMEANQLSLPAGASIKDSDGNNANLAHAASTETRKHSGNPWLVKTDWRAPRVKSIAITSKPGDDNTYVKGDVIELTFTFDEPFYFGGNVAKIVNGKVTSERIHYGRNNNKELPPKSELPPNTALKATLWIWDSDHKEVKATGPTDYVKTDACVRKGSDTWINRATLICKYTVKEGDNEPNGVFVPAKSLRFEDLDEARKKRRRNSDSDPNPNPTVYIQDIMLNRTSVVDNARMPAEQGRHLVDTAAPKVHQVFVSPRKFDPTGKHYREGDETAFGRTYGKNHKVSYWVSFNDNVTLTPSSSGGGLELTLDVGGTDVVVTYSDGTHPLTRKRSQAARFTAYTVADGHQDLDGIAIKGIALADGAKLTDAAGNGLDLNAFDFSQVWPRVKVDARAPAKPANLAAAAGAGQVTLTWDNPNDPSIVRYQYEQGTKSGGTITWSGNWQDMAGSGAATGSHAVTGLQAGTEYAFRIRAVDRYDHYGGENPTDFSVKERVGPQSDATTATPT